MKKKLLFLLLSVFAFQLSAQEVRWTLKSSKLDADLYRLEVKALIEPGWHIYDNVEYPGGPNPTVVCFEPSDAYETVGELKITSEVKKEYDEIFGLTIGTMEEVAVFTQDIRLKGKGAKVDCTVEWMACNQGSCVAPEERSLSLEIGKISKKAASGDASASAGLLAMILEAILWGLAALLTPCVFPMIPMTVSFFMKGSGKPREGRFKALMYGLFIVLLYTVPIALLIVLTRLIGGEAVTADIFNFLSTHWIPNLLFFIIFMVFAASFFGAFEIVLPSSMVNSSDQQVDKRKGLGGVFFLALTLVLVSFSCTGPIVGTVLIKSVSGEFWAPIVTMLAFSLAFALPFTLFALFPDVLKKLPKSGSWLNSVKVVLGFVEVALGFKFLSTADQVYHWGLLDREVYLAIWIVSFTLLGFYLLGKLKFKHDSDLPFISTFRLALSIVVFSFVVYMIPGMWGAPLKALSGYLPPLETQDFVLGAQTIGIAAPATTVEDDQTVKYSDFLELPLGLTGYFDLDQAEEAARRENKPLFIDFTGHGCVNCREMEMRVWSDSRVLQLLRDEFIICALYTDDKLQVGASDWLVTEGGKTLKTLGKINSYIALNRYGVAAQPNYVIQSPSGDILCPARGYDLDVNAYIDWLKSALR